MLLKHVKAVQTVNLNIELPARAPLEKAGPVSFRENKNYIHLFA